jgi:luciferase family oxidoreductase group 1
MLPNHAPLVIAEQFGTLAALFPGRIDLGLGRAPGTDARTTMALRNDPMSAADSFPQDVMELQQYFEPVEPGQAVRAVPGAGLRVPLWILGSSLFGAQLAAALGLPFAFASHFAPDHLMQAMEIYRATFKPSATHAKPYAMVLSTAIVADTDAQANYLLTSLGQQFLRLRRGNPGPLPPPVDGFMEQLMPAERAMLDNVLRCSAVGSPETVQRRLQDLVSQTKADELMVTAQIFDHTERLRSFQRLAEICKNLMSTPRQ